MPRQKKTQYSKVPGRDLYRKMRKSASGKWVALYGHTPQELGLKIAQFDAEQAAGTEYRENPLFSDYAEDWFNLKRAHLGTWAQVSYHSNMRNHVLPPMQGRRMKEIRPSDIQAALNGVQNMSRSLAVKVRGMYNGIFSSAVQDGIISVNPCVGLVLPNKKQEKQRRSLTEDQLKTLLDTVHGASIELFIQIAVYTGMRRGEILGLQWDCVDLGKVPSISVKRSVRWVNNRPICTEDLKSRASRRIIAIPDVLVQILKREKECSRSDFVVNTNGKPWTQSMYNTYWRYIIRHTNKPYTYWTNIGGKNVQRVRDPARPDKGGKKINHPIDFDVTPHMLRHTYATRLIGGGADVKTVQYLMGHETVEMSLNIYADLFYNRTEDMLPIVCRVFSTK